MSHRTWGMRIALVALAVVALAGQARAQTQNALGIPDSLVDWRYKLTPVFEAKSKGDVNANELGGKFTGTLVGINGLNFSSTLGVNKKTYRLRDSYDVSKQFINTLTRQLRPGLGVSLSFNDTRSLNRTVVPGGGFQDFVFNNQALNAAGNYTSPSVLRAGWDAHTLLTIRSSEFAFKKDRGQGGAVNGGVRYRFLDERMRVKLRGAYSDDSEKSTSIYQTFDGLSTTSDSLLTGVTLQVSDSLSVDADWTNYSYRREFADQSRTATGNQKFGAENLIRETERREYRSYGVGMTTGLFGGLSLSMSAGHSEQISAFVRTPERYSRTVDDGLDGSLNYSMRSGTSVRLTLSTSETLRDRGGQSVSSLTDQRKRVSLNISRQFKPGFSGDVTLSETISQQSYLNKEENPRDRDQHESSIRANLSSSPFNKITAKVFFSLVSTDFVSLFASQSGDNRTRLRYDLRPEITYTMNKRLTVGQGYSLAIEFTDYDYTLPGQDDFIDRNIGFWNKVGYELTRTIHTEFRYALTLHDRGSFLPLDPENTDPNAERFLDISRKDRTDDLDLSFKYAMTRHISVVTAYDYSRRRDETVGATTSRITTDGGIAGGVQGNYKWGNNDNLDFLLKRVERFSPFGTEKQKKYWEANLVLKHTF